MTTFAQRFVLEREIGSGGMARVFLARDEVLDRPVAIKILNPEYGGTDIADRFRREGRTAARLSHPNIVQVYDAGEDEFNGRKVSYIVMEYVSGGDLKGLVDEEGSLEEKELVRIGAEVASGLAHAHEEGVIHRDIKPHNILVDDRGRSKLTDFGIARALGASVITKSGAYLGTASYSSPEQLRGEKVTPKSDVYSLGATLYQAAVGETPFSGTPMEVASQHVNKEPTDPGDRGAGLSREVETLILRCIEKEPDLRPTAEEVYERLLDLAETRRSAPRGAEVPSSIPEDPEETGGTRTSPQKAPPVQPPSARRRREEDYRLHRRRRRPNLLATVTLFLVVLGIVAALMVTGGGEDLTALVSQNEPQGDSAEGGGQETSPASEEPSSAQQPVPAEVFSGGQEGGDPEDAAAQIVEDHYAAAADGDYDEVWDLLSTRYRQEFSSREAYTSQFDTLQEVNFDEGPTAQVSGDTATVTGETTARHDDRTERNRGTWTLVDEDGGWKIDEQSVSNISTEQR